MKPFIFIFLISLSICTYGQQSIEEILDKNIQHRVLLIRSRTDSLLKKIADQKVFSKFVADFSVTYQRGEFYNNYIFLNETRPDTTDIYDLTQEYYFHDMKWGISDTISICYQEFMYQFAPESNSLMVRIKSNKDFLKVKALNSFYSATTQAKLAKLIKEKKIRNPEIRISVDSIGNTYLLLVKDRDKPHYFQF